MTTFQIRLRQVGNFAPIFAFDGATWPAWPIEAAIIKAVPWSYPLRSEFLYLASTRDTVAHHVRLQEEIVITPESLPSDIYAIADVHGRADRLEAMLGYVAAASNVHQSKPVGIFLRDLIDRELAGGFDNRNGRTKLGYLVGQVGYFHEGHRAVDDCFALPEVLAQ